MSERYGEPLPPGFEYLRRWFDDFVQAFPHTTRNVFIMMPFTTGTANEIYAAVQRALDDHGLVALRVDRSKFADHLWWNILIYMMGSAYGIVIYEPKDGVPFNPNVSIEAGFMIALDRPVLLLANQKLERLPVDFSGRVFRTFDETAVTPSVLSGDLRLGVARYFLL